MRKRTKEMEKTISDLKESEDALKRVTDEMSNEAAVHQDEHEEAQMKIAELEAKIKEMELRELDESQYEQWDWNQIHFWMMTLDGGRFKKYEVTLKEKLSAAELEGEDLPG